ncbi:unnamed protein product [Rotaria sordida]|uniref:Uncharacterized protein n=1 Tax=Rotaria sordida TaxID=392033 RepID=A0A814L1G7_9BILA|nr:unnamed protein product [Rotaria sordida]
MNKDIKRSVNEDEFDSSLYKRLRSNVTCIFDLSDEIFLLICRYLSPSDVLYSFYTPEQSHLHFHHMISDYYRKIKLDKISNTEFFYLCNLFSNRRFPLRPESLILSNEYIPYLTHSFFNYLHSNTINSIFINLKCLILINCFSKDIYILNKCLFQMTLIQYLHISFRRTNDEDGDVVQSRHRERSDPTIVQFLFGRQSSSLNKVIIDIPDGFILYQLLLPNQSIIYVDLVLETIDDLYLLLSGLVPNVETMTIQLRRSRILSGTHPRSNPSCPKLTQFTLLESFSGFDINDIKSIFNFIPSVIKLTLSIRDTYDTTFCHGPKFESILNEYLPNLHAFNYTMTHRIIDQTLTESFIRWPMNVAYYENLNHCWIHIYSLPWPSDKNDKRELPIVKDGLNRLVQSGIGPSECVKDIMITNGNQWIELKTQFHRVCQLRTCLPINIELPLRISKVILTQQIHRTSINDIVQPFVRSLIVEHRLTDDKDISNLAQRFPNVEYLLMFFPIDRSLYLHCFQTLFSADKNINTNRRLWTKLKYVSMEFCHHQMDEIFDDNNILRWFFRNTDLKYTKSGFGGGYSFFEHSVWNGLTLANVAMPWFVWMIGISTVLSQRSLFARKTRKRSGGYSFFEHSVWNGLTLADVAMPCISVLQSSLNTEGNVGVNSLIVSNAFFLVSSIFLTHMLIDIFGLKWTTIICEIGFIFYIIANIRPLPSLMYISAGLVGLGAGPLWTSQATYISHIARYYAHRKEKKVDVIVSLFFGIFYAIYYTNLIWGNLLSYLVLNRSSQSQNFNCGIHFDPLSQTKTGASSNVSDVTRYVLCGIFAGMGVVSIILLVVALDQIRLAKPQSVRQSLKKSIELLQSLIKWKHLNQLFLAPLIIWSTMEHAFLVAQFTRAFITCLVGIRFIGLVLMCNGICQAMSSYIFGGLVKYIGRLGCFIIATLLNYATIILMYLWEPNADQIYILFIIAGLWGVAAAAWQSQIIAAYTVLYADEDPSALAKYRLWQSIGALSTYICELCHYSNDTYYSF